MSFLEMQQGMQLHWDRAKVWAAQSGLADYVPESVSRAWGTSMTPEEHGYLRDAFSTRVDTVQAKLNLPMRAVVLSEGPAMEGARHSLREAYRKEPTLQWLLGGMHRDPQAMRKENQLLRWWCEWRVAAVCNFAYTLAIPYRPGAGGDAPVGAEEMHGLIIVSPPGSKQEVHSVINYLRASRDVSPPADLGHKCKSRFCALTQMSSVRETLDSSEPHWYVHMLAVSPMGQGEGIGRALMRIVCAMADEDALPVHLEVSGSRNKAFFEKCGFRALQTLEVTSEDAPTLKINVMTRVPFPKSIELA